MALASWPDNLPYRPNGDGWANDLGIAPMAGDVDGPAAQQRSRPGDDIETITWSRAISRAEFATLRAFVLGTLRHGAARFWMPVTLDRATYGIRTVQIVAGSFTAAGINNAQVRVTMSLTVYPPSWVPPVPVVVGLGRTVTGTAPAGASVELRVGATLLYGTANAGGAWSIALPYMEGGTYSVRARIGDGPWSLPQNLTLAAPVYAEATLALFARMTVQPAGPIKLLMDTLVRAVIAAGAWPKMDMFYVIAAHDAQAARLNWIADQYNLTAVNSPVFTAFRGYTGNGTSSYLTMGAIPAALHASPGARFKRDNAHLAVWSLTNVPSNQVIMGARTAATSFCDIFPREGGKTRFRPNGPVPPSTHFDTPNASGLFLGNRTSSTVVEGYQDGGVVGTLTGYASNGPTANGLYLLAQNADGVAGGFCSAQVAMASVGAALTATEAAALHSAVRAYLVGVGAVA